ncbi:hypothetical protein K474DRAFT_1713365 [Panus rudis PR-1116 ss-1]|nr:hypothetical protein K474DRAFT_1713365 [Panus rudis PR-1116 ss-1]
MFVVDKAAVAATRKEELERKKAEKAAAAANGTTEDRKKKKKKKTTTQEARGVNNVAGAAGSITSTPAAGVDIIALTSKVTAKPTAVVNTAFKSTPGSIVVAQPQATSQTTKFVVANRATGDVPTSALRIKPTIQKSSNSNVGNATPNRKSNTPRVATPQTHSARVSSAERSQRATSLATQPQLAPPCLAAPPVSRRCRL